MIRPLSLERAFRLAALDRLSAHLNSRYGRLAQLAASLALIGWILASLDARTWSAIAHVGPVLLGLAVVLFASAQLFGGIRLALLLPGSAYWQEAILATWIGYFWGNFLPSTVGGDVVRGFRLHRAGISIPAAAGALILDRLANLSAVALVLVAGALSFGSRPVRANPPVAAAAAATLIVIGIGGGLWLVRRNVRTRALVGRLTEPLRTVGRSPGRLAGVAVMSLLSLSAGILAQWLIACALHLGIGLDHLATIICLVMIIVLLPVSLNGLGLQEVSFVVLLTAAGAPADLALSFSLLARALIVGAGSIAGAVVVADRIAAARRALPSRSA